MRNWGEFSKERPDLAEAGRSMFYQFGVGLAFLGTVRKDGGPRVHPMCPVIVDDGLYAFIEPGPKRVDLVRDGRYAMHGFPPVNNEDAFYITGTANRITDEHLIESIGAIFWKERGIDERPNESMGQQLFEFSVDTCLLTRTTGHGDWNPQHTIWKSG